LNQEGTYADLVITNIGQLLTMRGPLEPKRGSAARDLGIVEDAFMASWGGKVIACGKARDLSAKVKLGPQGIVVDAGGKVVSPGFVDAHTHVVFGGWRHKEYGDRCLGASYLEIAAKGGGILSTVKATREASFEELSSRTLSFLDEMLFLGTTTVEAKSGYGLSKDAELKQLRVLRKCQKNHLITLVPTFLGAHALPPEFRDNRKGYICLVKEMLDTIKEESLAVFVDVFCDEGAFTLEETREILSYAGALGFGLKVHADELQYTGATELACEMGAVSCDHLIRVSEEGIRKLARGDTIPVLLPATSCFMGKFPGAPGRKLWDSGAACALGTDFNPGTSTAMSMPLCMTLACSFLGFSPEEAFTAATWNAAWAVGLGGKAGGLIPGFRADALIFDAFDYREVPYRFGTNLVDTVVKGGTIVYRKEKCASWILPRKTYRGKTIEGQGGEEYEPEREDGFSPA